MKLFHDQKPDNPNLPPLLLPEYDKEEATDEQSVSGSEEQRSRGRGAPAPDVAQPARPRFDRSMLMRGTLTVPRSDYTETFTVWYATPCRSTTPCPPAQCPLSVVVVFLLIYSFLLIT